MSLFVQELFLGNNQIFLESVTQKLMMMMQ
jgi:hypothetical protein